MKKADIISIFRENEGKSMSYDRKKNSGAKNSKESSKFHTKNIKHDPNAESARAVFGLNNKTKDKP